ncbi:MAG: tetratricopeptide repeat protein [Hyphomicrobiales bacterium]|nr:tetratricopeptide repeat protein [Hyphomicrobiales bacterium]
MPTLQTAMDLHRQGRLNEAETQYRTLLAGAPQQFETLHLFGTLKLQQGRSAEASDLLSRAVQVNPGSLDTRSNLIAALLGLGRGEDALAHCNQILAARPGETGAYYSRGVALMQMGRHADALQDFDRVLAAQPDHLNALFNRANTLAALGRHDEAVAGFDRLLAIAPGHADALNNRSKVLAQIGRQEEAIKGYDRVLAIEPRHVHAWTNRAEALMALGRFEEALASADRGVAVTPSSAEAHITRANILARLGRPQDALACSDTALAINSQMPEAWASRGIALQTLGRYTDALESHNKALALRPDDVAALINRGVTLDALGRHEGALGDLVRALALDERSQVKVPESSGFGHALHLLGRYDEAIAHVERVLARDPGNNEARYCLSAFYLSCGRFNEGWPLHDSRFLYSARKQPRPYPQPQWTGERLEGPLLVWGEQGLGEQILYASTIDDVVARAGTVVMEVEPRLVDLFRRSFPDITIEPMQTDLYGGAIQAHVPIASLPHFVRHNWSDFLRSRRAYLIADAERSAALRRRLAGDGRKVIGLSWKSANPRYEQAKSAQLCDFAPVLELANCRFVDLQYGDTTPDLADIRHRLGVEIEHLDDVDNTRDIDGLAALMSACDLVVTVSNTTAHLAGALGRPTVVFVPFGQAQFWFWFRDRDDSVWYPDVRLKRQIHNQSWGELIASHSAEIAKMVS